MPRRSLTESPRSVTVIATVFATVVAVLATASPAHAADDLRLAAIRARVTTALATPSTPASLRTIYKTLDRDLARRDRPGLADDFAKLERVATACRGALFVDTELCTSLGEGVDAGVDAVLPAEDVAVARVAALVQSAGTRRQIGATVVSSRRALNDAVNARDNAERHLACRAAAQSAKRLARARAAAQGQVRRQDAKPPRWRVVLDHRTGTLLGVCAGPGLSPDVYVVGATDGTGPQFLRGSGEGWVQVPVAPKGDLWWVTAVPGDGIWASGSDGLVVHYDPATGAVADRSPPGVGATLFGIWGTSATNVIAVGVGGPKGHAFVRWDGEAWSDVDAPPGADGFGLTKIWGRTEDDVWVTGKSGTVLHFDGTAWSVAPVTAFDGSELTVDLLAVHGNSTSVAAVGAVMTDAIVERTKSGVFAQARLPASTASVAGLFIPPRGDAWACGYHGTLLRKKSGKWRTVPDAPDVEGRDLHSIWIDDTGTVWIVGGDIFSTDPMTDGFLHAFGPRRPSSTVVPRAGFASRVHTILTKAETCSEVACHAGKFASLGLDLLERGTAYAGLTNVASRQSPLLRVLPGRPSASYLWRKLEGTHLAAGGSGKAMPEGRDALPQAELDAVRAWILEGAPDSE